MKVAAHDWTNRYIGPENGPNHGGRYRFKITICDLEVNINLPPTRDEYGFTLRGRWGPCGVGDG